MGLFSDLCRVGKAQRAHHVTAGVSAWARCAPKEVLLGDAALIAPYGLTLKASAECKVQSAECRVQNDERAVIRFQLCNLHFALITGFTQESVTWTTRNAAPSPESIWKYLSPILATTE